jgi:hypothetical protein
MPPLYGLICEQGEHMLIPKKRKTSPKQREANRRNGAKSNGPRTPQGKQRVALNALKHGLEAQPHYRALLAVGRAYHLLLHELFTSLRPVNAHQRMLVEDLAQLRWERQRIRAARTGLVAEKLRALDRQRDYRLLEFDCDAPDLPQAEVLKKGLDRIPDSPAKFEKMLRCLAILIQVAKESDFSFDTEPELKLLYGEEPSLEGAYLHFTFRRFVKAQSSAGLEAGTGDGHRPQGGGLQRRRSRRFATAQPESPIAKSRPPAQRGGALAVAEGAVCRQAARGAALSPLLPPVHPDHPGAAPSLLCSERGG